MPYDKASRTPSLTVMQAKSTTVLEMEHNVVDFLTLCSTPFNNGEYFTGACSSNGSPPIFFSTVISSDFIVYQPR